MLRERFVTLLAQRGWSLEQFSEVSGVPFETAKNILSGRKDKSNIWNVNTEKEYHEAK